MATDRHGIEGQLEIDGEAWTVVSIVMKERLDEVPKMIARIRRDDVLPKPVSLLGKPVSARVFATDLASTPRLFNGLVVEAARRVDAKGSPYVELGVAPLLFKLTKRADVRSWLDKKADDILKEVFQAAGVPLSSKLSESYTPRKNTIQYRETDWDFVRRVCSEEGITLAWSHDPGQAVLFDDPHGLADAADKVMPYVPEFGFDQSFACVQKLRQSLRVVTDKVTLKEYDFDKPRTMVEAKVESKDPGQHALEVYAPSRSVDSGNAKRLAQVLLDSIQCRRDVFEGTASSWLLAPAQRFTLESHPLSTVNQELLVIGTELVHEDRRSSTGEARMTTRLHFEAIPTARSSYRAERRDRAAVLPGAQIATTTGASGQEIDVNDKAQVVALFPWDRRAAADETASVRMRTTQLPTGGSMLHPRVGWEVLVEPNDGDPDTPFVVGRLYNGIKTPPYALPGASMRGAIQTATTPGGGSSNELRTDDSKGKEEMFFNASKDMTTNVINNMTEAIGNSATLKVGANRSIEITNSITASVGGNQTVDVGGDQKLAIETFHVEDTDSDFKCTVVGNRDMKVGGDHRHTVTGDETIDIGGMKLDLVVGKISETADGDHKSSVGAASVTLTPANINMEFGGNYEESIGALKVVLGFGGIGSEVEGTSMKQMVAAKADLVDGDRNETSGAAYTSVAAGAQIIKADNIVLEGETMVTLVMGASILSVTPASVAFLGASAKLDGVTADTAALVVDN